MSTHPPFLQVLAASVTAVNKAGDLVRDIMSTGKLDIVEKENASDLQVSHSQNIYLVIFTTFKLSSIIDPFGHVPLIIVVQNVVG